MSRPQRRDTSTSTMSDRSIPTRTRRPTTSTMDSAFTMDESAEEWEQGQQAAGLGIKQRKKDEPMSPIVVILYVTAVYFIFQILTRSDDMEILSHLPATSTLRSALPHALGGSNLHSDHPSHNPYALPYHLPHIPSPIPKVEDGSTSFWRVALGVLVYPIYLIIALIAIPMPLLLNLLLLLTSVLSTLLYPLTSTARLLTRTFVLAPLSVLNSIFEAFYPIITFVGGVIGLGCVMGFGAGWAGKLGMDWIFGRNKLGKKRSAGNRSSKSERSGKSKVSRVSTRRQTSETDRRGVGRSDSGSAHELLVTPSAPRRTLVEETYAMPSKSIKGKGRERTPYEDPDEYNRLPAETYATAREPSVVGTRRRTHAFEAR